MEDHLMMMKATLVEVEGKMSAKFESMLSAVKAETEKKITELTNTTRCLILKFEASTHILEIMKVQFDADLKEMQEIQQKKLDRLETMLNFSQWGLQLHTMSISGDVTCPVTIRVSKVEDKKVHKRKWCSDPFYTHETGYRMCLRVIISGVGRNPGNHVSVFLYLMKGQYDNNLKWPLVGTFQIELLNQKMDEDHHTNNAVKFTATTPLAITNRVGSKQTDDIAPEGLGRNEFITHEDLKRETYTCQYLKDDCIFFRISQLSP